MSERWFEPEELEQLSRPTMDRAIEAIEAGDLEEAKRLCTSMKREWLMLHDLMAESVLGLVTYIQSELGDEGVKGAWEMQVDKGWRRHHDAIQDLDRKKLVYLLAATWRAHSGSGVGEHPGSFAITEDDEKITFTMNPCGSGQRLVRKGLYESQGYGTHARGARLVLRAQALPPLLHPLHVHEREDADRVERLSALPVGSAGGLQHGSLHLVLVQGQGRDPRAALGALRRRQAVKALVTGSNGGIGRAIVSKLRDDGFDVVTMDMTEPADLLVDLEHDAVPADALADIDVCVSNAGIVDILAPAHSMSHEKWERDIAVNLTGAFRVIQACLRGMRERGYGRIVVMSSFAARCGSPGQVAYCASKAGLLGMAKNLASENVSLGITVNSILPGLIGTPKVRALPDEVLDRFREGSGLLGTGRVGEPEEIAALVAFLASEQAGYITGQEIVVAGGGDLMQVSLGSSRR